MRRDVARCSCDAVLHVQFSPDGKKVASGGGDATVRLWDALANIPQKTYSGHKHHVLCLRMSRPMQGWSRPEIEPAR